jgi:Concanavalin A-like lectin/glucanases superfamily
MVIVRIVLGLVSVMLAACFTKPERPTGGPDPMGDGPVAEGWLEGWDFRKRVEMRPGITGTLAEFPVGLARTDPDVAAHADSRGFDLVATADDGTSLLSTELVGYSANAFELWVRIPQLAEGTAFYLYYGGLEQVPTTATWDGPFKGVWHLSDSGNTRDSTAFTNNMMSTGTRVPASVAGVFGGARSLDGMDDTLDGNDPPNGAVDFGTGSFSYSMWIFQANTNGAFDTPFYKGGVSVSEPGYCWLLGSIGWSAKVHDGNDIASPELGPASMFQNRWVHLAAVVDRGTNEMRAYADGASVAVTESLTGVGNLSTTEPLQLGRSDMSQPFTGMIDEVRIYNIPLELDWIRAEHANGTAADFFDVKAEEHR